MNRLLFFAAALSALASCQSASNTPEPVELKLAGKITNPTSEYVVFSHHKTSDTLLLSEDGSFSGRISFESRARMSLKHGPESTAMYAFPGDSIYISLDAEAFDESISYSGQGAELSNYLAANYLEVEKLDGELSFREAHLLEPAAFRGRQDSTKDHLLAFINDWHSRIQLPEDVLHFEQSTVNYKWGTALLQYEEVALHYQQLDSLILPEGFMAGVDELSLEQDQLLENYAYTGFVDLKLNKLASELMGEPDPEAPVGAFFAEKIQVTDSLISSQSVKNHFLHSTISDVIDYYGTKDIGGIVETYRSLSTDEEAEAEVMEEWTDWKRLAQGNPAPGFRYESIDGEMIELAQFAGKVVYVDVWATWCGPCRAEIPHLQAMEKEFEQEDLVFLSVSVDDSREDWEKMVREDELGGVQVITGSGWDAAITKEYKINGIPRFLLINRDGSIASADAERPSSGDKLREQFREALSKGSEMASVKAGM